MDRNELTAGSPKGQPYRYLDFNNIAKLMAEIVNDYVSEYPENEAHEIEQLCIDAFIAGLSVGMNGRKLKIHTVGRIAELYEASHPHIDCGELYDALQDPWLLGIFFGDRAKRHIRNIYKPAANKSKS